MRGEYLRTHRCNSVARSTHAGRAVSPTSSATDLQVVDEQKRKWRPSVQLDHVSTTVRPSDSELQNADASSQLEDIYWLIQVRVYKSASRIRAVLCLILRSDICTSQLTLRVGHRDCITACIRNRATNARFRNSYCDVLGDIHFSKLTILVLKFVSMLWW